MAAEWDGDDSVTHPVTIGREDLFPLMAGNLRWWVLELIVGTMKKGERMAMN